MPCGSAPRSLWETGKKGQTYTPPWLQEVEYASRAARARFEVATFGAVAADFLAPEMERCLYADVPDLLSDNAQAFASIADDYARAAEDAARAAVTANAATRAYRSAVENYPLLMAQAEQKQRRSLRQRQEEVVRETRNTFAKRKSLWHTL